MFSQNLAKWSQAFLCEALHASWGILITISANMITYSQFSLGAGIITLPALQRIFVNIFFVFALEFCIEEGRGVFENFSGLQFLGNEARKLLEKFGENSEQIREEIRDKNSKNSGNFRSATFLTQGSKEEVKNDHPNGNKYIPNSLQFLDVYVFALKSTSSTKKLFACVYSYSIRGAFLRRSDICVSIRCCSELCTYVGYVLNSYVRPHNQRMCIYFCLLGW